VRHRSARRRLQPFDSRWLKGVRSTLNVIRAALAIILNHVGGPLGIGLYATKKDETFAQWKAGIAELGKCQNVVVKLGGLGMLFGMFDFHTRETPPSSEELARAYRPYIETCIAACGPDRGMFESNFPPDGVSSSYPVLWNAFKSLAADLSADDKAKLFSGTANRVYRLA
jgi:L-fuconolactonase